MISVVMPMPGRARAQFLDDAQESLARVAAMHQFQDAVAAALQRQMRALAQFWQPRVGFHQIIAVTFGMRRREPDALQAVNFMNGLQQLNKSRFAIAHREIALAVTGDNLSEQRDFFHAARTNSRHSATISAMVRLRSSPRV